jgi:hypothetical protein
MPHPPSALGMVAILAMRMKHKIESQATGPAPSSRNYP